MSTTLPDTDLACVTALRGLSLDMVQQANSGHPGLPLGAAPMAYALWSRVMKFDPSAPHWIDRDRFVLSAGHGSALLYALLHLFGFDLPVSELKAFRQWGSKTPGHPEAGLTPGVEATTGPLGQGFANGVGMALAERYLASRYNTGGATVIDHFTYGIVSDGDLMEGVAVEAASLAGHLSLGKLIYLYDDNSISLDGPTEMSFTDDTPAKFRAMGWHVDHVSDGNDLDAIEAALLGAKAETAKPSLICVKTIIGYGSPVAGKKNAHSYPWPEGAYAEAKRALGLAPTPDFAVPAPAADLAVRTKQKGSEAGKAWDGEYSRLARAEPGLALELRSLASGELPIGWESELDRLELPAKPVATREFGKSALNAIAAGMPWLLGGAADLSSSTKTTIDGSPSQTKADPGGRNVFYGVREHAMGAVVNGLAYHGVTGFGSTFLVFSDYMRASMRLAALTHLPSVFVFTHDSVFVGEDGPTHEPVEQVMSLRLIPNLAVYRPADAAETAECWRQAVARRGPCALILTRQAVPPLPAPRPAVRAGVLRGAYTVVDVPGAQAVIVATGSEVGLALGAADRLAQAGLPCKVVSMPCWELFEEQDEAYRDAVLPPGIPVVSVEAGVTAGWQKWTQGAGQVGIDRFGASAPGETVYANLGLTVESVVEKVRQSVGRV